MSERPVSTAIQTPPASSILRGVFSQVSSRVSTPPRLLALILPLVMALLSTGCVWGIGVDAGPTSCTTAADCPGLELCLDNVCAVPGGCDVDADCPAEQRCIETGRCRANVQCLVDADCCPAGQVCDTRCTDYQCTGSQCTPGDSRDCFVGCHRGTENCNNGAWIPCNAAPIGPEICGDEIDNNCDNRTDEGCAVCAANEVRACSTPCGSGEASCVEGAWGACDAPDDCTCDVGETASLDCGNCGLAEATCGADGLFDVGECAGEGACGLDATEEQPCGNCGVQTRTCGADCAFGAWGVCVEAPDACVADSTQSRACGVAGAEVRTCNAQCEWGDYGTCDEQAACTPTETDVQPCGNCGTTTSVCNAQGQWNPPGPCIGQGQCAPSSQESETCGNCGNRSRQCNAQCNWGFFGACSGEGPCSPTELDTEACGPGTTVGICENGTRDRSCENNCQWSAFGTCDGAQYQLTEICGNGVDESCSGADETDPDQYEGPGRNNSCGNAYDLGTDPNGVLLTPTYDSPEFDRDDFFKFNGVDNIGSGETVLATLTNVPSGADLDLYLYKGQSACESGTVEGPEGQSLNTGTANEEVSYAESFGTSDDDTFYVRVRTYFAADCDSTYRLTVTGLR